MSDTKIITVASGFTTTVDAEDYEWLSEYKWHSSQNGMTRYIARHCYHEDKEATQLIHRDILIKHGFDLTGYVVDHIDGNGVNNVKSNLRIASRAQNAFNRQASKKSTTGYKNVAYIKSHEKYRVELQVTQEGKKKSFYGGYYKHLRDAVIKANELMLLHHGEFARLNIIPD